ncbi:hypothetical protein [Paenibacillus amylolyticus]|uniref:hypothetical protein n=1 Tax=Paenibacillus amylolyticus TaxID=1451 RepID=UPI000B843134|nr:hypothetical protein [Paenibacillus amylolyticus]
MAVYEMKFDLDNEVKIEQGLHAGKHGSITHIEISKSGISYRVWIPFGVGVNDGFVSHHTEEEISKP